MSTKMKKLELFDTVLFHKETGLMFDSELRTFVAEDGSNKTQFSTIDYYGKKVWHDFDSKEFSKIDFLESNDQNMDLRSIISQGKAGDIIKGFYESAYNVSLNKVYSFNYKERGCDVPYLIANNFENLTKEISKVASEINKEGDSENKKADPEFIKLYERKLLNIFNNPEFNISKDILVYKNITEKNMDFKEAIKDADKTLESKSLVSEMAKIEISSSNLKNNSDVLYNYAVNASHFANGKSYYLFPLVVYPLIGRILNLYRGPEYLKARYPFFKSDEAYSYAKSKAREWMRLEKEIKTNDNVRKAIETIASDYNKDIERTKKDFAPEFRELEKENSSLEKEKARIDSEKENIEKEKKDAENNPEKKKELAERIDKLNKDVEKFNERKNEYDKKLSSLENKVKDNIEAKNKKAVDKIEKVKRKIDKEYDKAEKKKEKENEKNIEKKDDKLEGNVKTKSFKVTDPVSKKTYTEKDISKMDKNTIEKIKKLAAEKGVEFSSKIEKRFDNRLNELEKGTDTVEKSDVSTENTSIENSEENKNEISDEQDTNVEASTNDESDKNVSTDNDESNTDKNDNKTDNVTSVENKNDNKLNENMADIISKNKDLKREYGNLEKNYGYFHKNSKEINDIKASIEKTQDPKEKNELKSKLEIAEGKLAKTIDNFEHFKTNLLKGIAKEVNSLNDKIENIKNNNELSVEDKDKQLNEIAKDKDTLALETKRIIELNPGEKIEANNETNNESKVENNSEKSSPEKSNNTENGNEKPISKNKGFEITSYIEALLENKNSLLGEKAKAVLNELKDDFARLENKLNDTLEKIENISDNNDNSENHNEETPETSIETNENVENNVETESTDENIVVSQESAEGTTNTKDENSNDNSDVNLNENVENNDVEESSDNNTNGSIENDDFNINDYDEPQASYSDESDFDASFDFDVYDNAPNFENSESSASNDNVNDNLISENETSSLQEKEVENTEVESDSKIDELEAKNKLLEAKINELTNENNELKKDLGNKSNSKIENIKNGLALQDHIDMDDFKTVSELRDLVGIVKFATTLSEMDPNLNIDKIDKNKISFSINEIETNSKKEFEILRTDKGPEKKPVFDTILEKDAVLGFDIGENFINNSKFKAKELEGTSFPDYLFRRIEDSKRDGKLDIVAATFDLEKGNDYSFEKVDNLNANNNKIEVKSLLCTLENVKDQDSVIELLSEKTNIDIDDIEKIEKSNEDALFEDAAKDSSEYNDDADENNFDNSENSNNSDDFNSNNDNNDNFENPNDHDDNNDYDDDDDKIE